MKQFLGYKETIAEITEIRMDAQFPSVAKRFDLFRLAAERFVIGVAHGTIVEFDLPVRPILDPVRRIDVDALDLLGHAFALEKRSHDQE